MTRRTELAGRVVLVTGASGFLGSRTVAALAGVGCSVRALVRKTSRRDQLNLPGVTIIEGDVTDIDSLRPGFAGAEYVVHAAADTRGTSDAGESSTVHGTRNILRLSQECGARKLVYISSCSVYGVADYRKGECVTEESPLERFPEKRGAYSHAKCMAEQLVVTAMAEGMSIVCLRPGIIYGPGGEIFTPMLGLALGNKVFAVIGDSQFFLPLVYVDNMVEAVLAAMSNPRSTGQIYNVIDPEKVSKKQYMEGLVQRLHPHARTVYFPLSPLKSLVFLQEKFCKAIRRQPALTLYRLNSSQKPVVYIARKIILDLAWQPPLLITQQARPLKHRQPLNLTGIPNVRNFWRNNR